MLEVPIGYVVYMSRASAKSDRLRDMRRRRPAPTPNWPALLCTEYGWYPEPVSGRPRCRSGSSSIDTAPLWE